MPAIEKGSFHMVDHWIRVHPEQNIKAARTTPVKSQVRPLREYVRIISTAKRDEAESASARLAKGEGFFQVAREISKDPTAPVGGYLGAAWLSQFDPRLAQAAEGLAYGEVSPPVDLNDHWIIIQRLPRDFKYQAGQLFEQAVALRAKGDTKAALEKYQQALIVYPNFLLVGMGTAFAETGNVASGAGVLSYAVQVYPDDADAEFNFGITLGGLGRHDEELKAYRRAIELDPDLDAAYENLGAACSASGDSEGAIEAFRKGLQIDPLSAVLYYDLSLVLAQAGDKASADQALALAVKIDPRMAHRQKQ
jgi:tetratricopeptide (TPR) repeat protein